MEAKKNAFELVTYNLEAAIIEELKSKYMDITIPPDDKAAYAMVMGGLRVCRDIRLDADEWHKSKKKPINKAGKHYDSEHRRVHGLIAPIEDHLKDVRKAEDDRIAAIEAEKTRREKERVDTIKAKIDSIREFANPVKLQNKTTDEIRKIVGIVMDIPVDSKNDFHEFTEEARLAGEETISALEDAYEQRYTWEKEEAERKAESARLEKIRQEQAEAQAKIDAENAKIQAEKDKIAAEKRAEEQRKREEEIARQAAERAKKEVQERLEREAQAKINREASEKAEAERREALKPDLEKVKDYTERLLSTWEPELSNKKAEGLLLNFFTEMKHACKSLIKDMEAL